jgi:hypothetical protein
MRAGLGDYCCPPTGLAKLYNNIPGNKEIRWMQGSEHGYVPPEYEGRDFVFKQDAPKAVVEWADPGRLVLNAGNSSRLADVFAKAERGERVVVVRVGEEPVDRGVRVGGLETRDLFGVRAVRAKHASCMWVDSRSDELQSARLAHAAHQEFWTRRDDQVARLRRTGPRDQSLACIPEALNFAFDIGNQRQESIQGRLETRLFNSVHVIASYCCDARAGQRPPNARISPHAPHEKVAR